MYLDILLFAGLLKASGSFHHKISAGIWTAVYFLSRLLGSESYLWLILMTGITYAVSWSMFKVERENTIFSLEWTGAVVVGGALMLFVL